MQDASNGAPQEQPDKWGITRLSPKETDEIMASRRAGGKASELRRLADTVVSDGGSVLIPCVDGKFMGMAPTTLRSYFTQVCGAGVVSITICETGMILSARDKSGASNRRKAGRCEALAAAAARPENLGVGLFILPQAPGIRVDLIKHFMAKICPDGYQAIAQSKDQHPFLPNGRKCAKFGFMPTGVRAVQIAAQPFLRDENGVAL